MTTTLMLTEVPPIYGDTHETVAYRRCDWCDLTACEDIWAGRREEAEWRRFYEVVGEGLTCCEHCLPLLFAEGIE